MKKNYVLFYGSTKVICGHNSLSAESTKRRNQLVGFEGTERNEELSGLGEKCLNAKNADGITCGESGTLYPNDNITIVPFRYEWCIDNKEDIILKHLDDVIEANERYIKADSIGFPLMELKKATMEGRNMLGKGGGVMDFMSFNGSSRTEREKQFADKWCCFGHYYLVLIKKALNNKGYLAMGQATNDLSNLRDEMFINKDGRRLMIYADAGM
jgi:hypothetical protein